MRGVFITVAFAWLVGVCGAASIEGTAYSSLRATVAPLGMTVSNINGKDATAKGPGKSLSITAQQRSALINGTKVWLSYPVAQAQGGLWLSQLDYKQMLIPLLAPQTISAKMRLRHIVIDAGHGGKDTGTRSKRMHVNEKAITLDLAGRLKQELEGYGYRVTLTRSTDNFIELKDRPAMATALHADLFISIHINASEDTKIYGAETYAYTPFNAPSTSRAEVTAADRVLQNANVNHIGNLWLAYDVQKSLVKNLATVDRGVRHARFVVLETLTCPGILVECGFLSNPSEGSRLTSALYRQQIADAITAGVRSYHRRLLGM